MDSPVIDTCVILDMFLTDRPRHSFARQLLRELSQRHIMVTIPYTALFEISVALRRHKIDKGMLSFDKQDDGIQLEFRPPIAINDEFFDRYFDPMLPPIKAGDLLFLAIAKHDKLPLITEDGPLAKNAVGCDVRVYSTQEYLKILHGS